MDIDQEPRHYEDFQYMGVRIQIAQHPVTQQWMMAPEAPMSPKKLAYLQSYLEKEGFLDPPVEDD